MEDEQSRYIEANVRAVVFLYILANGNPINSEKFDYKIAWMEKLKRTQQKASRPRSSCCFGRRFQRCTE